MRNSIKHTFHIGGMSCGGCVSSVKNRLVAAPNVTSVSIDLANKQAEITSSVAIKAETLQNAFTNTHYTISELSRA
jgi:copper chaperone CopZ